MDNITTEEKEVVDELRRRTISDVTPKMLEDVSLFYRFSKARDFNLAEAEAMLRKHIVWRKEMDVDTILTDYKPPEVLVKYCPISILCFDKEGSLIRIIDVGRLDVKGLFNAVTTTELTKYIIYNVEQDRERMIRHSRNHGKTMYSAIYDFEDLSYANAVSIKGLQNLLYNVKLFLDNYPEMIGHLTVINAPFYFAWILAAVKPVLPPAVLKKLRIYGRDGWKNHLVEIIDADELPSYLGGNKTDPDGNPLCETFILRGRPIPKNYYMKNRCKKLSLDSDVEKLTVMPFSKEEITFEVKEKNSSLEWEFETKNRYINFSLIFREEPSEDFEPVELIPQQRIDTSYGPEKGWFKCEKVGKYTIVFDNSFSWIRSKEVYYRIGAHSSRDKKNVRVRMTLQFVKV